MSDVFDILPERLYRSRRGVCPFCGASLPLAEQSRQVECGFCGGASRVERRLRRVEPEVLEPTLRPGDAALRDDARWLADALGTQQAEPVLCPGCGSPFAGDGAQAILTCAFCATSSKLERRLVRVGGAPRVPPRRRTRADLEAQRRDPRAFTWDVATEQLCWRLLNEPESERQLALTFHFECWSHANATLVYFLPWLLERLLASERVLAARLAEPVGKLLCGDDRRLYAPTLEACAPFVARRAGTAELIRVLGLGSGLGLKLLLEAAERAAREGRLEDTVRALFAVNWIFDRNRGERARLREIFLYRLLYLHGPVLGWALEQAHYSRPLALYEDPLQVLRFLDDCAFERPALVAPLQQACFYQGAARDEAEFRARLAWLDVAETGAARAAVLMHLHGVPRDARDEAVVAAVARLEALLDDPALAPAATLALRRFVSDGESVPGALVDLVRRRGHALPARLLFDFLRARPDSGLVDPRVSPPGQPEDEPALPDEIVRAREQWRELAGRTWAADSDAAERLALHDAWERARRLDVPLFLEDGDGDGAP